MASGWVEQEHQAAQNQHAKNDKFHVIPLRLDDVTPPGFLSNFSNIEMHCADSLAHPPLMLCSGEIFPPPCL